MQFRPRLPDGSLGPFEKVFKGETPEEKMERLEEENANLVFANIEKDIRFAEIEEQQAGLLFELINKGVL